MFICVHLWFHHLLALMPVSPAGNVTPAARRASVNFQAGIFLVEGYRRFGAPGSDDHAMGSSLVIISFIIRYENAFKIAQGLRLWTPCKM